MSRKPIDPSATPYVGPRPYRYGETIYGRGREIIEIRNLLLYKRVLLLHAPSGAGKTSLLQAGLIPELVSHNLSVHSNNIRVNKELEADEYNRLSGRNKRRYNRYLFSLFSSLEEILPKELQSSNKTLAEINLPTFLEQRLNKVKSLNRSIVNEVWIFDQFEEVLSLDPTDLEKKEEFFAQVGRDLQTNSHMAVFSMRDDFVGSIEPLLELMPDRLRTRYHLDLLNKESAQQAIVRPAKAYGVTFTKEAYDPLIADLLQTTIQTLQGDTKTVTGLYIEPVQLQVVCEQIWKIRQDPKRIRAEDLNLLLKKYKAQDTSSQSLSDEEKLTFVDYALGSYYEEKMRDTAKRNILPEFILRDWMSRQLITPRGLRGQVMRGPHESQGLKNEAIDDLVDAHLVHREERRGLVWYELAHDRLVRPVQMNNRSWFQSNLQLFQRKAIEWDKFGRPEASLLAGGEWDEANQWAIANSEFLSPLDQEFLTATRKKIEQEDVTRRLGLGTNLADVGWGILFPGDEDPTPILEALKPLLDHRRKEAFSLRPNYREFTGPDLAHKPGQLAQDWLRERGVISGPPNASKVPYYLLIIAPPEKIPFEFQFDLDERFAVGRLYFPPDPSNPLAHLKQYAAYAQSLVDAETGRWRLPRRISVVAPSYPDQEQWKALRENLVDPLYDSLYRSYSNWQPKIFRDHEATLSRLGDVFGGKDTPAVLVTATIGEGHFSKGDGYAGTLAATPIPGEHSDAVSQFITAADIEDDARVGGLLAFLYGESTVGQTGTRPAISSLAQRLLGHPGGGALAIIGHVDEARPSTSPKTVRPDLASVQDCLNALLTGKTAGMALDEINQRYVKLRSDLLNTLLNPSQKSVKTTSSTINVTQMRLAASAARNYILLGDPAARLPEVVEPDDNYRRPELGETEFPEAFRGVEVKPASVTSNAQPPEPEQTIGPDAVQEGISGDQTKQVRVVKRQGSTIVFNGIDLNTGNYWLRTDEKQITNLARSEKIDRGNLYRLRSYYEYNTSAHFGVAAGYDSNNLRETGWGIILPEAHNRQVLEAIQPLVDYRKMQAGEDLFKVFTFRPSDDVTSFLNRYKMQAGPVDPNIVPYYLLILASPEEIPYSFQTSLSLYYAVGRLDFQKPEDYSAYARGVMRAEKNILPRRMGFFCPTIPLDLHTQLLHNELVLPLRDWLQQEGYEVQAFLREEATQSGLKHWLASDEVPGALFMAGHGLVDTSPHSPLLGSLVCQDWPGLGSGSSTALRKGCFAGEDLPSGTDLTGRICFLYYSFSAGLGRLEPDLAQFYSKYGLKADMPFTTDLPRRMLSLASGAALAVVGFSGPVTAFYNPGAASNRRNYSLVEEILYKLLWKSTIGASLESIAMRYAELVSSLNNELEEISFGKDFIPEELAALWADSKLIPQVTLFGDPAVRLNIEKEEKSYSKQSAMRRKSRY